MVAHRILISLSKKQFSFWCKMFVTSSIVENDNIGTFEFCKVVKKHI